jgi:hypothetical protein
MPQAMAGRSPAGRPSSAQASATRHTGREPGGRPQLAQFEIESLAKSPSRPDYTPTSLQPQPTRADALRACPRSPAGYRRSARRHRGDDQPSDSRKAGGCGEPKLRNVHPCRPADADRRGRVAAVAARQPGRTTPSRLRTQGTAQPDTPREARMYIDRGRHHKEAPKWLRSRASK